MIFAPDGLAPIDGWALAAIVAKALAYAVALLAAGGPLVLAALPRMSEGGRALAVRLAVGAAILGAFVLALRVGVRAARISGMGLDGALDATMLSIVWESPLGSAGVLRLIAYGFILLLLLRAVWARRMALVGSVLLGVSFAQVGHSLGEPRWILGVLVTVHILAASFWVGALAPLSRAAVHGDAAALHRFGTLAVWAVGALVLVGVAFAYLMSDAAPGSLFGTAYGWTLFAKLGLVSGLLGLAALNKLRLVPAIAQGEPDASLRLKRSIAAEWTLVTAILLVTAFMTSVTVPPVNLGG